MTAGNRLLMTRTSSVLRTWAATRSGVSGPLSICVEGHDRVRRMIPVAAPSPSSSGRPHHGVRLHAVATICFGLFALVATPHAVIATELCGDFDASGTVAATDALLVLKTAVGQPGDLACPSCAGVAAGAAAFGTYICGDVDGSGGIAATDALRLLRYAVGEALEIYCPCPYGGTTTTTLISAVDPEATDQIYNVAGSTPSLAHSLVEDGLSSGTVNDGGNLFADPVLSDPDGVDNVRGSLDDDLRPLADSPVVDAGSAQHLPPDAFDLDDDGNMTEPFPFDIAGAGRALGLDARPDMGAYETTQDAAAVAGERAARALAAAGQQIRYVRAGAVGDGTSWANAYGSLQDALAAAEAGNQIWVAAGIYRPDEGTGLAPGDRSLSFELKPGVRVHGGFAGTESSLAERNLSAARTILSGDLAADDDGMSLHEENSRHVVRIVSGNESTLLEGVTLTGGNADGAGDDGLGGGILVEGGAPWIVNTHVFRSMADCGGGIALIDATAARLVNTVVNGNRAAMGGGVCIVGASPSFTNATVTSNTAVTAPGIYNDAAGPAIANSIISGNRLLDELAHCEAWQYPCSFTDVPEEVLAASVAVMQGAWAARAAGTMLDALAYLQSHPDVVHALGDSTMVGARVRGSSLDFLVEAPSWIDTAMTTASAVAPDASQFREQVRVGSPSIATATTNRNIVGEDRNGDGKIDNRDGKRALVIDPWNTGDALAVALSLARTRDYRGRVVVEGGDNLGDYQSWHDFDFVYVSTRVIAVPFIDIGIMETPIPLGEAWPVPREMEEVQFRLWWYKDGFHLDTDNGRVALTPRFFRKTYDGTLDNTIVYCAGCNIDVATNQWAEALGKNNFGLLGWDGNVDLVEAAPHNVEIVARMATGLDLDGVIRKGSEDLGTLGPHTIAWQPTDDARFMRLIELPLLRYPDSNNEVLRDGADLTESVAGTAGNDDPDGLELHLVIQGVIADDLGLTVRYVVDGRAVPGTFDLHDAIALGSDAFAVTHYLDLGFPLKKGVLPIEVIAEVPPDDGESRFSVNAVVDAFDCSATATVSGFRDTAFSGPAGFSIDPGVGLALMLTSLEWAIGSDPDEDGIIQHAYEATFFIPNPPLESIPGEIEFGNENFNTVTSYDLSDPWLFGTSHTTHGCEACGGTVRLESLSDDGSILEGEIDFTGMEGDFDAPDLSRLKAKFRAARGDHFDAESPYGQCIRQYWQID
jgi:hypothetical protein